MFVKFQEFVVRRVFLHNFGVFGKNQSAKMLPVSKALSLNQINCMREVRAPKSKISLWSIFFYWFCFVKVGFFLVFKTRPFNEFIYIEINHAAFITHL